jgi:hypothetical protein
LEGWVDRKVGRKEVAGLKRWVNRKVGREEVAGWQQGWAGGNVGREEVAGWQLNGWVDRWPAARSVAGSASSAAGVAVLEKRRSFGQYMGTRRWRGDEA